MFSGVLGMSSFDSRMHSAVDDPGTKGWLVSILELGAWLGVLFTGYLADKLSRKYTIVLGMCRRFVISRETRTHWHGGNTAVIVFCIGVVVQTAAFAPSSIFGGTPISGWNAITRLTARTSRQAVLSPVWASDPSVWLFHCTSGSPSRTRSHTAGPDMAF